MAQSVERRIGSAEVTGPIPVSSFIFFAQKRCGVFNCSKKTSHLRYLLLYYYDLFIFIWFSDFQEDTIKFIFEFFPFILWYQFQKFSNKNR